MLNYYVAKLRYLIPELSDQDSAQIKTVPASEYEKIRQILLEDEKEYVGYEYKREG